MSLVLLLLFALRLHAAVQEYVGEWLDTDTMTSFTIRQEADSLRVTDAYNWTNDEHYVIRGTQMPEGRLSWDIYIPPTHTDLHYDAEWVAGSVMMTVWENKWSGGTEMLYRMGLDGMWRDSELGVDSYITLNDDGYAVTGVVAGDVRCALTGQSWDGNILTWSFTSPTGTVQYTTLSQQADSLRCRRTVGGTSCEVTQQRLFRRGPLRAADIVGRWRLDNLVISITSVGDSAMFSGIWLDGRPCEIRHQGWYRTGLSCTYNTDEGEAWCGVDATQGDILYIALGCGHEYSIRMIRRE